MSAAVSWESRKRKETREREVERGREWAFFRWSDVRPVGGLVGDVEGGGGGDLPMAMRPAKLVKLIAET